MPAPTFVVSLPVAISKPPPLAFTILPMLIVYKTVEYLKGRSKYSIGLNMDKHNKSKAVLTPLLSVSECWRRAVLESICDNCALNFDHSHEARKIRQIIDEYQCTNAAKTLLPLNRSLRVLEAYGKRCFSDYYLRNSTPKSKRLMAPELNHYCGMIVSLACCLPKLDTLQVSAQSVDSVTKGIDAIVSTNVGLEYIGCLQHLRVQPLEY
ncbi:hypothetical protein GGI13_002752 [Coemansia sp. RSA 455]|nr:hypothetical protein GGI13_002752 [Coemansia sp. RSA 455]